MIYLTEERQQKKRQILKKILSGKIAYLNTNFLSGKIFILIVSNFYQYSLCTCTRDIYEIKISSLPLKYLFNVTFFFNWTNFVIKTLTSGEVCVILQTSEEASEIIKISGEVCEIIPKSYLLIALLISFLFNICLKIIFEEMNLMFEIQVAAEFIGHGWRGSSIAINGTMEQQNNIILAQTATLAHTWKGMKTFSNTK